jgi:hypothetical protein
LLGSVAVVGTTFSNPTHLHFDYTSYPHFVCQKEIGVTAQENFILCCCKIGVTAVRLLGRVVRLGCEVGLLLGC